MEFNKLKIDYIDENGELQETFVDFGDPIEPGEHGVTLVSITAFIEYTEG